MGTFMNICTCQCVHPTHSCAHEYLNGYTQKSYIDVWTYQWMRPLIHQQIYPLLRQCYVIDISIGRSVGIQANMTHQWIRDISIAISIHISILLYQYIHSSVQYTSGWVSGYMSEHMHYLCTYPERYHWTQSWICIISVHTSP